jgi:lysophospholipase L1-like esterase
MTMRNRQNAAAGATAALAISAAGSASAGEPVQVVFFGDSITDGNYLPEGQRIDVFAQPLLRKAYGSDEIVCRNISKGGSTVARLMSPGREYETRCLPNIRHIDVAVLQFGINDEDKFTPEEFGAELAKMCDRISADFPGCRFVLCTSAITKGRTWWQSQGPDAEEPISQRYYARTRTLAAERGYPLADLYQAMVASFRAGQWDMFIRNQKLSRQYYGQVIADPSKDAERAGDGMEWFNDVHPNACGLTLMAAEVAKVMHDAWPAGLPRAGA